MRDQPTLFTRPRPYDLPTIRAALAEEGKVRTDHPGTAREAAASIAPCAGTLREKVYEAIRDAGGLTDEEIQDRTGIPASTERPRRVELVEAGRVVDSTWSRATRSGRRAIVWKVRL